MEAPVQAAGVMGSINRIERAHQMYREGRHEEALAFYMEALAMARTKAQRIALHSNRAACYFKLHDFKKVLGIPWDVDMEGLRQYMSKFGELDDCIVMKVKSFMKLLEVHITWLLKYSRGIVDLK